MLATDTVTDLAVVRSPRTGLPVPQYSLRDTAPGQQVTVTVVRQGERRDFP